MTTNTTPLRDVLYAFSIAQPVPDASLLEQFARRHPEHASALTEFAIELLFDTAWHGPEQPEETITPKQVSPSVSRALSTFQNRLFDLRQRPTQVERAKPIQASPFMNPFAALSRSEFRELAERMDVNALFLSRLRDREIDPATMTDGFKQYVARELKAPPEVVAAHFTARSEMSARQLFKADEKPRVSERRSFKDAVLNSQLSESQQRRLMSL